MLDLILAEPFSKTCREIGILAIVLIAFLTAGWPQLNWVPVEGQPSSIEILSRAMVESAGSSVEVVLGLVGVMPLFLD